MSLRHFPPQRIICLTEETVETLYLLGEDKRIIGVTGYAVRPPQVRQEKPRVGAFTSAKIDKILELEPDLVLTFSDLQADITSELIKKGITVMAYNQRDIAGILAMIRHLGAITGAAEKAERLAHSFETRLSELAEKYQNKARPKVYFEEWDIPMISGIKWVSELIYIAGGQDIFPHLAAQKAASDRFVSSAQVIEAQPDIMLASWCGKKVQKNAIIAREGWHNIPAIAHDRIIEIKSPLILQPGPAALTDGLDAIEKALQ